MRFALSDYGPPFLRTLLRLLLIVALVALVSLGLDWVKPALEGANGTNGTTTRVAVGGLLVVGLVVYALLMAIPFVPGVEVGISLLMMQGARIAPFVFLATFTGLSIAYLVGRHIPLSILRGSFADLAQKRACALIDRLEPLDQEARLAMMRAGLPRWLQVPLIRFRYLSVALALNIPGNALIGGGGGIALVAGLSGLFKTRWILLTFALAVAPVPILVMIYGMDVLSWWK